MVIQMTEAFFYQSYYDSTLLNRAVHQQPIGHNIVPSTRRERAITGTTFGLHPSSQTPVAVEFKGAKGIGSAVMLLKPGQIVRPFGRNQYTHVSVGLPFGWLGGGIATMVSMSDPDADVLWPGVQEVVFHRQRVKIRASDKDLAGAADSDTNLAALANWPTRFPWKKSVRSDTAFATLERQGSGPIFAVQPTKVVVRVRSTDADAFTLRFLFFGTDNFDVDGMGTPTVASPASYIDVPFAAHAATTFEVGGVAISEYRTAVIDNPIMRLGGDEAVMVVPRLTWISSGGGFCNDYEDGRVPQCGTPFIVLRGHEDRDYYRGHHLGVDDVHRA
jgi:hypothetical protein